MQVNVVVTNAVMTVPASSGPNIRRRSDGRVARALIHDGRRGTVMHRLAALIVLMGLGLLAGCGSTSGGWTKPGMTEEGLGQDTLSCLTDARTGPRVGMIDQDRYRRCMADRGYVAGPAK